ncbi:hypothetical protein ABT336_18175 [Micromonospora sp. NPDC000207]|uniref:hypothetical protein n=1 Tax=Micromonospora sp. NPDC000207 TaxID=3154246 RepID=UPI00332AD1B8
MTGEPTGDAVQPDGPDDRSARLWHEIVGWRIQMALDQTTPAVQQRLVEDFAPELDRVEKAWTAVEQFPENELVQKAYDMKRKQLAVAVGRRILDSSGWASATWAWIRSFADPASDQPRQPQWDAMRWQALRAALLSPDVRQALSPDRPDPELLRQVGRELDGFEMARFKLRNSGDGTAETYPQARAALDARVAEILGLPTRAGDPSRLAGVAAMQSPHHDPAQNRPVRTPDLSPRSSQHPLVPGPPQQKGRGQRPR